MRSVLGHVGSDRDSTLGHHANTHKNTLLFDHTGVNSAEASDRNARLYLGIIKTLGCTQASYTDTA